MTDLPAILEDEHQRFKGEIQGLLPEQFYANPNFIKVIACSPFVANYCRRSTSSFIDLVNSGDLDLNYNRGDYESRLALALEGITCSGSLMRNLRCFRNREMVRIAWRDISQSATLKQTLEDLSMLAEIMLDQTLGILHTWLKERFGEPVNSQDEPQKLVVIAVGKLGAHELNFSSDIDLIFAYPEAGGTRGGDRTITNQEFFIRLGIQLIHHFNDITEHGFVFRVDMRLRPFGQSGALALSFDAMEDYYVSHARDWERYAMIKANIAAGDKKSGVGLMAKINPFVYRRYLDYSAFEAIRKMKQMIDREILRKGMEEDIKLGAGGIREVEFIGQTFQLLRGGREASLQKRSLLEILGVLSELGVLNEQTALELTEAYCWLRNTEHRIQQIADQQTQRLPNSKIDQARIALGMECKNWSEFKTQLDRHRANVEKHFSRLLNKPIHDSDESTESFQLLALSEGRLDIDSTLDILRKAGYTTPESVFEYVSALAKHYATKKLSNVESDRIDCLFPLILQQTAKVDDQLKTLKLIMNLIEAVVHRSVYLSLLEQQPVALTQLIKLCAASPWIATYITQQPTLLDDLICVDSLYSPLSLTKLEDEIERQLELKKLHHEDLELRINQLRHFKHSHVLRVAAADITDHLPVSLVSNCLTDIAESVVSAACRLAYCDLIEKYGTPCYLVGGVKKQANLGIIAYGKMGGYELGYGSDLDVVFLHDSQGQEQKTDGKRSVENSIFFNRLAQRLIHFLTIMTSAGRTYEIDTRLRPSGASGFLVSSIHAFRDYQSNKAWTWEHQALVRARFIHGNQELKTVFNTIRTNCLSKQRDESQLKKDVVKMRRKMRDHLIYKVPGSFDIKHGKGGMADIEFIVQYCVLRWASTYPDLLQWTDNLRLLETLAKYGLVEKTDGDLLQDAYFTYRSTGHRRSLQDLKAIVADTEYVDLRNGVQRVWRDILT